MKKKKTTKNSPPVPHLLQAQQAPALPYAKAVGRPSTGSYPAPSPDPTTHPTQPFKLFVDKAAFPSVSAGFGLDQVSSLFKIHRRK